MKPSEIVDRARVAAKDWLALNGHRELSEKVLLEAFRAAVPSRERTPGDDIVFRATFVANVTRMKAEKRA